MKFETLYDVLNVSEKAPPEVIRAAFKTLSSLHHPDKRPDDSTATALMQEINAAYAILGDPASRAQYDARLHSMRTGQSSASQKPYASKPTSHHATHKARKTDQKILRKRSRLNPWLIQHPLATRFGFLAMTALCNPLIYVGGGMAVWFTAMGIALGGAGMLSTLMRFLLPHNRSRSWLQNFVLLSWIFLIVHLAGDWYAWKKNWAEHAPLLEKLERLYLAP